MLVVLLLVASPLLVAGRVALFGSSGGYLTRERGLRLEGPTAQGSNESICYVGPASANNVVPFQLRRLPFLCYSDALRATNLMLQPNGAALARFEDAGGVLGAFWNSRWSGLRVRATKRNFPFNCAALADDECASNFGADFKALSALSSNEFNETRGLWAFCGESPEPKSSEFWFIVNKNETLPCVETLITPRTPIVDECWTKNPCIENPLDCQDPDPSTPNSAICANFDERNTTRTTIFNRCVSAFATQFCIDLWSGLDASLPAPSNNATLFDKDGDCAFGVSVTRDGNALLGANSTILNQQFDLGLDATVCQQFNIGNNETRCDVCASLVDIKPTTSGASSTSACVEMTLSCDDLNLVRLNAGCFTSTALARCEATIMSLPSPANGTNSNPNVTSRCIRATPLSPDACIDVETKNCSVSISVRVGERQLINQTIDAADIVANVTNSTTSMPGDFLAVALIPRDICLQNSLSPCSTCVTWRTNETITSGNREVFGCASVNVTCLEQVVASNDLGCFPAQRVPSQCVAPCTSSSQCNNGACSNGICVCNSTWHGARCNFQCPNDCSGAARGVCTPPGTCVCVPPFSGPDCARSFNGMPSRNNTSSRKTMTNNDINGRGFAPATLTSCPLDCNRQGDCVAGSCVCYGGFAGTLCDAKASSGLNSLSALLIALLVLVVLLVCGVAGYAARVALARKRQEAPMRLVEDDTNAVPMAEQD